MLRFAGKPSHATERAFEAIDRAHKRRVELARIEQQARHDEFIRQYSANPSGLLMYLSSPLQATDPFFSFASTYEAAAWLRKEIARQESLMRNRHWAFNPDRLAACHERLPIAEYFAEHGKRLWARSAA